MPNKKLIIKKLTEILRQLRHLEEILKLSPKEIFSQPKEFYFTERVMERLIGAAIDINMHLASDLNLEVPSDYYQSFIALGKLKIIPESFAKKLAPSGSFRNILVHEYQEIDEKKFYNNLNEGLKDYKKYAIYIEKYLKKCL